MYHITVSTYYAVKNYIQSYALYLSTVKIMVSLVSTDLNLKLRSIIKLYSYRFKIECTFRELKQVLVGFSY